MGPTKRQANPRKKTMDELECYTQEQDLGHCVFFAMVNARGSKFIELEGENGVNNFLDKSKKYQQEQIQESMLNACSTPSLSPSTASSRCSSSTSEQSLITAVEHIEIPCKKLGDIFKGEFRFSFITDAVNTLTNDKYRLVKVGQFYNKIPYWKDLQRNDEYAAKVRETLNNLPVGNYIVDGFKSKYDSHAIALRIFDNSKMKFYIDSLTDKSGSKCYFSNSETKRKFPWGVKAVYQLEEVVVNKKRKRNKKSQKISL